MNASELSEMIRKGLRLYLDIKGSKDKPETLIDELDAIRVTLEELSEGADRRLIDSFSQALPALREAGALPSLGPFLIPGFQGKGVEFLAPTSWHEKALEYLKEKSILLSLGEDAFHESEKAEEYPEVLYRGCVLEAGVLGFPAMIEASKPIEVEAIAVEDPRYLLRKWKDEFVKAGGSDRNALFAKNQIMPGEGEGHTFSTTLSEDQREAVRVLIYSEIDDDLHDDPKAVGARIAKLFGSGRAKKCRSNKKA